jgi:hypothetical protein
MGRGAVKRKIGLGGGWIFKGSGFYLTDYRSEGYKQAAKKNRTPPSPLRPPRVTASPPADRNEIRQVAPAKKSSSAEE